MPIPQFMTASMADTERERPLVINKKRARQSTISETATPMNQTPHRDWAMMGMDTNDSIMRSTHRDPGSPMPFVNTRYQIAGGLDTPTAQMAGYFEESEYSDTNYRRNLSNDSPASRRHNGGGGFEKEYHSFARLPSTASMESNGRPRMPSQSQEQGNGPTPQKTGWSQLALNVVGGVVGKVWQFCKAGAFTGFGAGGGQKYEMNPNHTAEQEIKEDTSMSGVQFPEQFGNDTQMWSSPASPIPGRFPSDSAVEGSGYFVTAPDYGFSAIPSQTPRDTPTRPGKRRQISAGDPETGIGSQWVVVNNSPAVAPSPAPAPSFTIPRRYPLTSSSSARRTTAYNSSASKPGARALPRRIQQSQSRLPTSQVSYAGSPAMRSSNASYASPRVSTPQQSRIPVAISPSGSGRSTPTWRPTTPGLPPVSRLTTSSRSRAGSARNSFGGSGEMGSMLGPSGGTGGVGMESPSVVEAKKWAARKKKEDAQADEDMRRLNRQLKAMIREGREALGTRVEVEMFDDEL